MPPPHEAPAGGPGPSDASGSAGGSGPSGVSGSSGGSGSSGPCGSSGLGRVPEVPLDGLLSLAAAAAPGRIALHACGGPTTFAELDDRVTDCAAALTSMTGGCRTVVGIAAVLDPAFVVAYYATARAGHTIALVNPLLRAEALAGVLATAKVSVAVVPPQVAARIEGVRDRLPDLRSVMSAEDLVGDGAGPSGPSGRGRTGVGVSAGTGAEGDFDLDSVACVQFTSGTTGEAKAVRLTHRNLVVNAAQIAAVHGLDGESVTLNHLPLYHPMHLNSAVYAAATQVLCPGPDAVEAVGLANRHGATHYYSLPVRLAGLAADPRLPELRLDTVRAVLSGGSALLTAPARALGDHFGIPVVQGYGLAETSPLTHCEPPGRPRPGSVGLPVPGTDCRVVDVESRVPLGVGKHGEVQIRGPQLMKGYLGAARPAVDADGWFSTGDVGRQDKDGYLFLVDRIKDVFKCENWLVSPTEIERVLIRHPAVRDCAVVDHPQPARGAVAHAFVVLHTAPGTRVGTQSGTRSGTGTRCGPAGLAAVSAQVNEQMPYYQHIHYIDAVEQIPRSPNGKILRRELRKHVVRTSPARSSSDNPAGVNP